MTKIKALKSQFLTGIAEIIILVCGIMFVGCSQSVDTVNESADYATFKTEKTAWETTAVTEYYLTLTHANGSARYTTASIVKDDTPQYVETGGASLVLTDNFPFQPLAQTIQEIYKILEEKFSQNASLEVVFDTQSHTPIYVTIKNYNGSGKDYILTADFTVAAKGDEPLNIPPGEYREAAEFDMNRFIAERDAWLAQDMQDYRYVIHTFLSIPTVPVLITVSANADSEFACPSGFSKADFEQAKERDALKSSTLGKTIDELYSEIEYIIKEEALQYAGKDPDKGVKIAVVYNTECHYPESFSVMYYRGNDMPDGGGISFEISGFEQLK